MAPASPGSIISVLAMAPKGQTLVVLAGVLISTAVSLLMAAPFVRRAATAEDMPTGAIPATQGGAPAVKAAQYFPAHIRKVVFACDAGMGSSALGATRFRKRLSDAGIGMVVGKVRAMIDDKGRRITSAGPSVPVSIMGLDEVPDAGDTLYAVSQELTKQVAEERKNKLKNDAVASQKVSLDDVFNRIAEGEMKTLNIIVKADVQGSVEAVKSSLAKLSNDEVKVNVIHAAVGAISETDIMLAESSGAVIIGFNVRPDSNAKNSAEKSGVDIKLYRVIYEAIEDVQKALKGMLAPKYQETYMGKAEVRETFKITGVGTVAGCYVTEGKIVRNGKLRIYRDDIMICEGNVLQLKRFKDDVKEVNQGFECGISIEKFNDIKIGDFIESYVIEEVKA